MRLLARLPLLLACLFVLVFVAAPLLAMLWETLTAGAGSQEDQPHPWQELLADDNSRARLLYSCALGTVSTLVALVLGFGHAWLTFRTDLPMGRLLGPLGVAPLVIPPIFVAMGFADLFEAQAEGFWCCAFLLGVCYAPFVAVMTARGLRSIDGRLYEAALLARGQGPANRLLCRMILPEVLAGCLFALIFVLSEYGVPEFLTVKGKAWHTYAEEIHSRWSRRAAGADANELVGPVVAAVPLVLLTLGAMFLALRLRAHTSIRGTFQQLPIRRLGSWRWPALALPVFYLACGVALPVVVMAMWSAGSTVVKEPMSLAKMQHNFATAFAEGGEDLVYTLFLGAGTVLLLLAVAVPIARAAARGRGWLEYVSILPVAVPAILLAIGLIKVFNSSLAGSIYDRIGADFYDSWGIVVAAYAARFLPFAVLTLSHASRRISPSLAEAARLTGRSPLAQSWLVNLPLLLPAIWSAGCLIFILALRELDIAVMLPAGNGTVVRRLSNIVHFGGEDTGGALALLLLFLAIVVPALTVLVTGKKLRSLS